MIGGHLLIEEMEQKDDELITPYVCHEEEQNAPVYVMRAEERLYQLKKNKHLSRDFVVFLLSSSSRCWN